MYKVCGVLVRFHEIMKLQSFEFSVIDVMPTNLENISPLVSVQFFLTFVEKKPPIKFHDIFDHFSRTYEVGKFLMVKLYLNVSEIRHANEHKSYANCGLHVNFLNVLLISFCFMMKKDHFKQKLLLFPQVPFK